MVDAVAAPANYDEFARNWGGYVLGFVRKLNVPWQEADDVAQEILLALIQADILKQFNPGHAEMHDGEMYGTKFKAFLNRHVYVRVLGRRDALRRRRQREALIMDREVSPGSETTWADLLLGTTDPEFVFESPMELTTRLRQRLEAVPRRSSRDKCDLPVVFDCILQGVAETGEVDYAVIEQKFGISTTAARGWVRMLRDHLATCMEAEDR